MPSSQDTYLLMTTAEWYRRVFGENPLKKTLLAILKIPPTSEYVDCFVRDKDGRAVITVICTEVSVYLSEEPYTTDELGYYYDLDIPPRWWGILRPTATKLSYKITDRLRIVLGETPDPLTSYLTRTAPNLRAAVEKELGRSN